MEKGHVVLFPFMAQGHLIPFLSLATLIEQRNPNYTVTLISTPLNILNLRPSLPPNSTIHLTELPFPKSNLNLPPGIENTQVLPPHLFTTFFYATETLKPSFESLISSLIHEHGRDHLCIIADPFLGWTVESAKRLNVFHSVFATGGAYGSAIIYSIWSHPPNPTGSLTDDVPLTDYPDVRITRFHLASSLSSRDGMDLLTTFIRRQLSLSFKSGGLLVNTVEELEKVGVSLLRRWPGLKLWTIGPLIRSPSVQPDETCLKWLDSKPPGSVLYVSFGSQNTIPIWQMMDLAAGLEASGRPFIWVIRPPIGFDGSKGFRSEWLPEGFEDRIRKRKQGILVQQWAPQLEILSHPSTGAFLSHCGWNSVMESLSAGVPIIGWPLLTDQLFNSKMLVEEMGVCVEAARGRRMTGVECGWERVARVIQLVIGETDKGREMRRKAGEIREMMREALREEGGTMGSSVKAIEDFLHTALSVSK